MTEHDNIYKANLENVARDKIFYSLAMFPYPSGAGLHVGHGMNFTANDIMARFKRMQGYTVINPIGWDSFGLPTENYAIKLGKPAGEVTTENIANYKKQCELMDRSYDWDRELTTSSPEYYKWTQWIFAQLYKSGLVYKKDAFVNRCPDCQTVLANDQVVDGHCERCSADVIQKKHPQWFIKITDYAEKLIDGLDTVDRPEETKTQQRYWIGKSQGAEIEFEIDSDQKNNVDKITVFTTRPDTIFGVTAIVLAPENASIDAYIPVECKKQLDEYRVSTAKKTAIERQQDLETKSGLFSGVYAIHPLTHEKVPVWFADYVLPDYATGAVMFVPAHDERDFAFAKKHGLSLKQVILPKEIDKQRLQKLFTLHQEIQTTAEQLGIDIYMVGGLSIPLRTGVIYRNHNDLDYVIRTGDRETLLEKFVDRISKINNKEHGIVEYIIDNIEVEFISTSNDSIWIPIKEENYDNTLQHLRDITGKTYIAECIDKIKNIRNAQKDIIDLQYLSQGAYTDQGVLINSGTFDGLDNIEAKKAIITELEKQGVGRGKITYKLRDWSVSRQRYWGSPIPVYYTFDSDEKVDFIDDYSINGDAGLEWNYKQDFPIKMRSIVHTFLYDTHTDRYLILDRGKYGTCTIGGGIENGESIEQAGLREALEESGYKNIRFFKKIQGELHQLYYHPTKAINYYSPTYAIVCEVDTSKEIQELDPLEAAKHTTKWMTLDEIINSNIEISARYFLGKMLDKNLIETKQIDFYNAYNPHPDRSKWIPHLIPEDELPVVLPLDLGNYKPAGKSPLADHPTFPYYKSKDGNVYLRECDTLDTFMCSSFYFLRFVTPHNEKELISKELAAKAMPVDFYIGGKEHTYGHLLYSRFINRFLYEQGYIGNPEPFQHLFHQGMVLGPDGRKMSKRWGNVITPADLVEKYGQQRGADVLRTYTMFMGPLELEKAWNDGAVDGVKRFLDRVERMQEFVGREMTNKKLDTMDYKNNNQVDNQAGEIAHKVDEKIADTTTENKQNLQQTQIQLHKTIKGVTEDIQKLKFNTAVSKLMIFVNYVYDVKQITKEQFSIFIQLLAPFATKLTQELREKLGQEGNIHLSNRPAYDDTLLAEDICNLPVQINGKMRGNVELLVGVSQDEVVELVTTHEKFAHHFENTTIKKVIYIQDKIVNFIVG